MKNSFAILLFFPLATTCADKLTICTATKNTVPLALQAIVVQPANQNRLPGETPLLAPPQMRYQIVAGTQLHTQEKVRGALFTCLANAACGLFWSLL
ncbi:MAG TPA: hypothetical protein VFF04_02500 [Candidatus Babeliales bacterium]|nr:hypothetical protein [Candidatus Babeliales bacterium]